jgi:hypothetical protein
MIASGIRLEALPTRGLKPPELEMEGSCGPVTQRYKQLIVLRCAGSSPREE